MQHGDDGVAGPHDVHPALHLVGRADIASGCRYPPCVPGRYKSDGTYKPASPFPICRRAVQRHGLGIRLCLTVLALITLLLGARYPLYALNKVTTARRDLNACFLTFHSLGAAPAAAHSADTELAFAARRQAAGPHAAFLPAFAFVPYKVRRIGF